MNLDLTGIAGVISAVSLLAGSQGVVAWVARRQMRSDVGDTGDSSLVEMVEGLNVRISNLEHEVREHLLNGDSGRTTTWYTQQSDPPQ